MWLPYILQNHYIQTTGIESNIYLRWLRHVQIRAFLFFSECDKLTTKCNKQLDSKYECTCREGFERYVNNEYSCKKISNEMSNQGHSCFNLNFNPVCSKRWAGDVFQVLNLNLRKFLRWNRENAGRTIFEGFNFCRPMVSIFFRPAEQKRFFEHFQILGSILR